MDVDEFAEILESGEREPDRSAVDAEGLLSLAHELRSLDTPDLSPEAEDRIFAMIQQKIPEPVATPSKSGSILAGIGASLPRPLIQKKADRFAAALDDVLAGKASRQTSDSNLIAAAMALAPLPAIAPSASFVDWLEVRLMSPAMRADVASISSSPKALRGARVGAGLAAAAAAVAVVVGFNLQSATETPTIGKFAPIDPSTGIIAASPIGTPAVTTPVVSTPKRATTSHITQTKGNGNIGDGGDPKTDDKKHDVSPPPPPPADNPFNSSAESSRSIMSRTALALEGATP